MVSIKRMLLGGMLILTPLGALAGSDSIVLGMGCFWGAEKRMSEIPGVLDVESGYAGGDARKADYQDVLDLERAIKRGKSDRRNHAEVIKVSFDPERVSLETILKKFWESHDPTQGDRQGNDVGSNYRSAIYTSQRRPAMRWRRSTRAAYQRALTEAGHGQITTEIAPLRNYNRAEEDHQDYLKKNPDGYCGLGGTGVVYPGGIARAVPPPLAPDKLNFERQLIVFEAEDCPFCKRFRAEVLNDWRSEVLIATTLNPQPPKDWKLEKTLFATPTIVLFEKGREVSRYTGYQGDKERFWKWLGLSGVDARATADRLRAGHRAGFHGLPSGRKTPRRLRRSHHRRSLCSAATPSSTAVPAGRASSTRLRAPSPSTRTTTTACTGSRSAAPAPAST